MDLIHSTKTGPKAGTEIWTLPGKKTESPWDFIVKYKEPNGRARTPKHIHIIVEMYVKHAHNPAATLKLRDHILSIFEAVKPINYYPPRLQYYKPRHLAAFDDLNKVGEFSVEFLLIATELIMIQERTNYPSGSLTYKLFENFGAKDRFSVVNTATMRRMG
jgi:hypothetical protein